MKPLALFLMATVALPLAAARGTASGATPTAATPAAAVPAQAPAAPAELAPLSFLLGKWVAGANTGAPGQGTGWSSFERSLGDRVILRTNHAEYPATEKSAAAVHDDLKVIYVDGGAVEARYFDSEGHCIHYAVTTPGPAQAVFLGDVDPKASRYRLSYKLRSDAVLEGTFEVAPPGKPEAFARYLSWESHGQPGRRAPVSRRAPSRAGAPRLP